MLYFGDNSVVVESIGYHLFATVYRLIAIGAVGFAFYSIVSEYIKKFKGGNFMGVILFIGFVLFVTILLLEESANTSAAKSLNRVKKNVNDKYENYKFSLFNDNGSEYLLITENNTIVFTTYDTNKEININDILKVELKYNIKEKNKQKVLTVMPTFDKDTSLISIELKIFTYSNNDLSHIFKVIRYPNLEDRLENNLENRLQKFKYLVEDIKSKSTNN